MLRILSFLFLLPLLTPVLSFGQKYVKGQVIIMLQKDVTFGEFTKEFSSNNRMITIDNYRKLSKSLPIYLIESESFKGNEKNISHRIAGLSSVALAQVNHYISQRGPVPNDTRYGDQWQWNNTGANNGVAGADVSAEKAWGITTGGITAAGDTIVVCVVDDGTDTNHEDLVNNLWFNKGEIPDNSIDDDGNGYVDDVNGWNFQSYSSNVNTGNHGVNVGGMIGASGNNGIGVSGINWNVKIMNVVYAGVTEDAVIQSYDYPLQSRLLYNSSNGAQGSFVVSVNSSWGIDYGKPEDAPIWCNFYDIMGEAGILNVAATANGNINVDEDGDLPTACPSPYLISVGRTTKTDLYDKCGYGPISIDLGAPGVAIVTTRSKNRYTTTSGTSFASPLVAGMVALLYSYPCDKIGNEIHKDYAAFALAVKNAILNGVDVKSEYADKCLSGGRANTFKALENIALLCSACQPESVSELNYLDENNYNVIFANDDNQKILRYRPKDSTDWVTVNNVHSPLTVELPLTCTEYEFQMQTICPDDTSAWGPIKVLKSARCCNSLDNVAFFFDSTGVLNVTNINLNQDVNSIIHYKETSEVGYTELEADQDTMKISGLKECTFYDIFISALCIDSSTVKSKVYKVFSACTSTCGNFNCIPNTNGTSGYIEDFKMNGTLAQTGDNNGYINFGDHLNISAPDSGPFQTIINIKRTDFNDARLRLYIDFNKDNDISAGELFWEQSLGTNSSRVEFTHDFYNALIPGTYKMRLMLVFNSSSGPCDAGLGETEDYCLEIYHALQNECKEVDTIYQKNVTFTSIDLSWDKPQDDALVYVYRYKELPGGDYTYLSDTAHKITLKNLESCKDYEFGIYTVCFTDSSNFKTINFRTDCTNATNSVSQNIQWKVFPNPFVDNISVLLTSYTNGEGRLRLTDAKGSIVYDRKLQLTTGDHYIDLGSNSHLLPGMYILTFTDGKGIKSIKLIKQ